MLSANIGCTYTIQVSAKPLEDVAIILTAPTPFELTNPFWSTVAIVEVSLFHTTVLLVAFSGSIVAVNCSVSPSIIEAVCLFNTIELTGIVYKTTFTEH